MTSLLKLGTRRSLLAWAQSNWVARQVEKLNPGIQVELIGIETRGDRIQDISLRNVAGKEFFVAEIDDALATGQVDFTVHSMKDLSLERPPEFIRAAVPRRENPRDVVLFGPRALVHLREGRPLTIGTSSPRRIENIPSFLKEGLPHSEKLQLDFVEIRGNVNTRLSRVHEDVHSSKYLDAVVLAFAGIHRLWVDTAGQAELKKLLKNVRWMILPLKECPAAPAQGALAIECRRKDLGVIQALEKLNHHETVQRIQSERQLLADWGGGCHQRFGATEIDVEGLGPLLLIRGKKPDGTDVDEVRGSFPGKRKPLSSEMVPWDGSKWRAQESPLLEKLPDLANRAVFVAHSRALPHSSASQLEHARVWTSGTASWGKLAKMGVWVEGCAENLGFESLIPTLQEGVLDLPRLKDWVVLTHEGAVRDWEEAGIQAVPTYKINFQYGNDAKLAIQKATHVFWSSGSQFDALKEEVDLKVHHACGPGKTAARLRKSGLNPEIFPTVEEWRQWIKTSQST
jgi:hydroxymethylbilane synthase